MISINLSDIAIWNIKTDYCCIIRLIGKNEAIKLLQNADLTEKSWTLWNTYIKMGKEILTFGNIETEKNKFYCQKRNSFIVY